MKTFVSICIAYGVIVAALWVTVAGSAALVVSILGGGVVAVAAMNLRDDEPDG